MARLIRHDTVIHLETHGQGPAILLTHGFGATCRMWDEQIEALTGRYRMILWDLPGHGQSEAPPDGTSQADVVEDMHAILEAAEAPRAVLIGLGVGGLLSLRLWRRYPNAVRGLVLVGTLPGLRTDAARALWNARIEALAASVEEAGIAALEGGAEVDPGLHANPAALVKAARLLLSEQDQGALPWLAEIDVPVLILTGGADQPTLSAARFMERTIPGARAVTIPRANHAVTLHKPDAANAAIAAFLGRLPP